MYSQTALKIQDEKFDLTEILTEIIDLIIQNTGIFRHIDMKRVLVCTASNRKNSRGGTYGKLIPLKFKDGESVQRYRGRYYTIPGIINNDIEQMYIIYFYVPRFFDLDPVEKLRVIFHELYHISESFNGDIRRMGRRKKAHGFSTKRFNSLFDEELQSFNTFISKTPYFEFLKMDTQRLRKKYRRIYSRRMKIPKPVILEEN